MTTLRHRAGRQGGIAPAPAGREQHDRMNCVYFIKLDKPLK
jgi:hypothetical protein